jgi:dGTPase
MSTPPKMEWRKLLSTKRLGKVNHDKSTPGRSEFQRDFDRITFSTAFRRLQDKAQVVPLSENDYPRTRLTHSIEASCVGRSLGKLVGEKVLVENPSLKKDFNNYDFGEITAAACLAHDIGNPPFGHSGEAAIQEWFFMEDEMRKILDGLSDDERTDFLRFEGNAQGYRILTKLQCPSREKGLYLTCSTLGAFTKYPTNSFVSNTVKSKKSVSLKKHGFVKEDENTFREVAEELGLIKREHNFTWARHPLSFLVEAADDICFRIVDFEDAFHLNNISFDDIEKLFYSIAEKEIEVSEYKSLEDGQEKVEFLRGKVITALIKEVSEVFFDKADDILKGEFDEELIDNIKYVSQLGDIKKLSIEKAYKSKEVLEIEIPGFKVIGGLLDISITAVNDLAENSTPKSRSEKIVNFMPGILGPHETPVKNKYKRMLFVTDFISGMTDSFAVSVYKKINGISLQRI